jgi:ring-1,2-phenylacetyl-CoA epoxidase subunit PaaE
MGLFDKLFKKKEERAAAIPKGFVELEVGEVVRLTASAVKVVLNVPTELEAKFAFKPGQYVTIAPVVNGKTERRSYSICSLPGEPLSIGVKEVQGGLVSTFVNRELKAGDRLPVSTPEGGFTLKDTDSFSVGIAAGSGITPVLAIAGAMKQQGKSMHLIYGNRSEDSILFRKEIEGLAPEVRTTWFLSQEEMTGFSSGRITKETLSELIRSEVSLLRADGFYICGPEEMIVEAMETLKTFGVKEEKIHVELFTTPVLMKPVATLVEPTSFTGTAQVEVILDDETIQFELGHNGPTLLDKLTQLGEDAPYSCKGGVCCTCKAKVTEGKAIMQINYSLTDKEVEQGYILTCQARPASPVLKLTFDE